MMLLFYRSVFALLKTGGYFKMANDPRRFEKTLQSSSEYYMEVDVSRDDCNREGTHWHLCKKGQGRIGQISIYGDWARRPEASASIIKEAEELTSRYSYEIEKTYSHNRDYGAGY